MINNQRTIIPATTKDADDIAKLVNSAYRGDSSRKGWTTEADLLDGTRTDPSVIKELIEKPDITILKYSEDDTLIGCVELHKMGTEMYLGMLTVKPDLQGTGIGKKLLEAAEAEARTQHCLKVTMTVISVRQELIDWYKRHGYTDTGKRKPFSFNDPRFGIPKSPLQFAVLEKILM